MGEPPPTPISPDTQPTPTPSAISTQTRSYAALGWRLKNNSKAALTIMNPASTHSMTCCGTSRLIQAPSGVAIIIETARGSAKRMSSTPRAAFITEADMVETELTNSPMALARSSAMPSMPKVGTKATAAPTPPMANRVDSASVSAKYRASCMMRALMAIRAWRKSGG